MYTNSIIAAALFGITVMATRNNAIIITNQPGILNTVHDYVNAHCHTIL